MTKHNYKDASNGTKYGLIIYCEYCGHVAYDLNRPSENHRTQKEAETGCKCSPPTMGPFKNREELYAKAP